MPSRFMAATARVAQHILDLLSSTRRSIFHPSVA